MIRSEHNSSFVFSKNAIVSVAFALVLLFPAVLVLNKPAFNYDLLPYMGVVLSYEDSNPQWVHHEVYARAAREVPPMYFNRMTDPGNSYRSGMANSPTIFQSQLPFYVVKPLYTRLAYLFYHAGLSLSRATIWPSLLAWYAIGLLVFYWLRKYLSPIYAALAALLLMIFAPVLTAAGLSTPDAVSALWMLLAIYGITETGSNWKPVACLVLAIFTRLDNFLPAVLLLGAIWFIRRRDLSMSLPKTVLMLAILCLAYLGTAAEASKFGWGWLYYPSFARQLNNTYSQSDSFHFNAYWQLAKVQLNTGLYFSSLSIFLYLSFCNALIAKGGRQPAPEWILGWLFLAIIVLRFLLQPVIADRFYLAYYLATAIFIAKHAVWRLKTATRQT